MPIVINIYDHVMVKLEKWNNIIIFITYAIAIINFIVSNN